MGVLLGVSAQPFTNVFSSWSDRMGLAIEWGWAMALVNGG